MSTIMVWSGGVEPALQPLGDRAMKKRTDTADLERCIPMRRHSGSALCPAGVRFFGDDREQG